MSACHDCIVLLSKFAIVFSYILESELSCCFCLIVIKSRFDNGLSLIVDILATGICSFHTLFTETDDISSKQLTE